MLARPASYSEIQIAAQDWGSRALPFILPMFSNSRKFRSLDGYLSHGLAG
jgi:hypothetical protein